jgi:hypothetical protein
MQYPTQDQLLKRLIVRLIFKHHYDVGKVVASLHIPYRIVSQAITEYERYRHTLRLVDAWLD